MVDGYRELGQLASTALLVGGLCLGGCAGYANYPKLGASDIAVNNPNTPPVPQAEYVALRWVIRRYPVEGPYTVNFPAGTYRRTGERFLELLEDPNARLLTPANSHLPTYHVKRVWVRGERATVEVLRPVLRPPMDIPSGAESTPLYQSFWVKCEAGWKPWRVVHARAWPIGRDVPPNLQGWPDEPPPPGSRLADPSGGVGVSGRGPGSQSSPTPPAGGSTPAPVETPAPPAGDAPIEEIPVDG